MSDERLSDEDVERIARRVAFKIVAYFFLVLASVWAVILTFTSLAVVASPTGPVAIPGLGAVLAFLLIVVVGIGWIVVLRPRH